MIRPTLNDTGNNRAHRIRKPLDFLRLQLGIPIIQLRDQGTMYLCDIDHDCKLEDTYASVNTF